MLFLGTPPSSPPVVPPPDPALLELSRLTMWSIYNNNIPHPEAEPQRCVSYYFYFIH